MLWRFEVMTLENLSHGNLKLLETHQKITWKLYSGIKRYEQEAPYDMYVSIGIMLVTNGMVLDKITFDKVWLQMSISKFQLLSMAP